ncbi:MAG: DUF4910 domain-containing protein [Nitrospirae bacterium]|nr:DUF4910 domain-containing protein [Nitrospirota bacterium]
MKQIISDLYLKDRTFICDDYDYCLDYLKKYLDLSINEYPSGAAYWNWIIPDKYTVKTGFIKNLKTGEIVVDVKNHPMHLASYSTSFEGIIHYEQLKEHLQWSEKVPEGIPNFYKFQYRPWVKDWKICLSYNQFNHLDKDVEYYVKIETIFEKGTMKVAHYLKKGAVDDTIVLVSHLDHPGQVNDGLSGVVVELAVMQELIKKETHYSYLFLIVQEFIGSVAFLSQSKDIKNYKMGLFSEMLTTGLRLQLQKSFNGDSYIDKAAEMVFMDQFGYCDAFNYIEGAGNDEIVFESPGIEVPFISIMRVKKDNVIYRQYHTHLDNIDMVNELELEEAFNVINRLINTIEQDYYVYRNFNGFICLSNPNIDLFLDKDDSDIKLTRKQKESFHKFQFGGFRYFDGRHRISEIAQKYDVPFDTLYNLIKKMEMKNMVSLRHDKSDSNL